MTNNMPHTPPETVEERFKKAFNPAYYAHSTWIEGNEEQLLSFIHQEITRAKEEREMEFKGKVQDIVDEIAGESMDLCENSQEFKQKVLALLSTLYQPKEE